MHIMLLLNLELLIMDFKHFISTKTKLPYQEFEKCLATEQNEEIHIINGIPRFVDADNYTAAFGLQWNMFSQTQFDSFTKQPISENRLEIALGQPLETIKGLKVLEAGSGAGRFTEVLLKYGAEVYSFDLSDAVEANYENNMPHQNLTLFQGDIMDIHFQDDFFDISLCLGVLQHTPSSVDSIRELTRVLKKGGKLVFDHYKFHPGHYLSLYLLYWFFIERLKTQNQLKVTDFLTKIFFPVHWYFKDNRLMQFLLRRISPIAFYYGMFDLSKEQHYEFSRLDTHDKNTDHFKRHLTERGLEKIIRRFEFQKYEINHRGNGLECIAIK